MTAYAHATVPVGGERITATGRDLQVPDRPIPPFIEGDGIGIEPIGPFGTKRHVAASIRYAIERGRASVTLRPDEYDVTNTPNLNGD